MSLGAARTFVRHRHDLNAALSAYATWLWSWVDDALAKDPRFVVKVYLTGREGDVLTHNPWREQVGGISRRRYRYWDRVARRDPLGTVVLPVYIYRTAVRHGPETFTSVLVHELAHARDAARYILARHDYEHYQGEDDWAYDALQKASHDTDVMAEIRAVRTENRVMMSIPAHLIANRLRLLWDDLRAHGR